MSRYFLTNINLNKNELQNAAIQALGQDPLNPTQGQIYFSTVTNSLRQWTGSDWIDYLNSADGSNYIESVDANFSVVDQELHLADSVNIDTALTIGGGNPPITGATATDGTLTVKNAGNDAIFDVDGYNARVNFYAADGTHKAQTEASNGAGVFRIVTTDDLALRSTAGDIILYPGEKNGSTGKAFVGWGNAASGRAGGTQGLENEITTAGNSQTLTNKIVDDVIVTGTTSFQDDASASTQYLSIYKSGTGASRLVSQDDLSIRSVDGDIILYPGSDDGGTGKAYVHWGDDSSSAHPEREITTAGNSQDLTNKTIADATVYGKTSFKDATSGDTEYLYIEQAYTGTARFVAPDDISIRSTGGDIILYPGSDDGGTGKAYIGWGNDSSSAHPEREIATKGYVDGVAQGLDVIESVFAATSASVSIGSLNMFTMEDAFGISIPNGGRVLIKNQDDPTENGIYVYDAISASGVFTLSTLADDTDLRVGSYVLVTSGDNAATGWIVTSYTAPASTWTQFSAANEYTAGTNIAIVSNQISISGQIPVANGGTGASDAAGAKTNLGFTTKYGLNNPELTPITGQVVWSVNHELNTTDITVSVRDIDSGAFVEVDVATDGTQWIDLTWNSADIVPVDSYRVVVIG